MDISITTSVTGYIVYAILGYHLSSTSLHKNKTFMVVFFALAIISWVARYVFLCFDEEHNPMLFSYFGLYAVLPATLIFLVIRRGVEDSSNSKRDTIIMNLSKCSFGVYLLHVPIIKAVSVLFVADSLLMRTLGCVVAYLLTVGLVVFLRSCRITRWSCP